jgi:hypothetical protein
MDCMSLNVLHYQARFSGGIGVKEERGIDSVDDFNTRGWGREICMGFHGRSASHVWRFEQNTRCEQS